MNRIILTDPRIKDGTMMYQGEYVVLDLECESYEDYSVISDINYNVYVDGDKLERTEFEDLTKEDPEKYQSAKY